MSKKLSAKLVNNNLKKGWTIGDFAEYYEISEEEFLNKLRKNFQKRGVEEMLAEMKKNRKKVNCNRKKIVENVVETNETIGELEVVEKNETVEFTEVIQKNKSIEELQEKAEQLSQHLCAEESNHKSLVSRRRDMYDTLRIYKSKLVSLQRELQECMDSVIEIDENISKATEEMAESNSKIASLNDELKNIRSQIEARSKINIFAYEDGNIEIDGEAEIPAEWSGLAMSLTANEELEFLTVRQIKQLAKLVVLTHYLETKGVAYDLMFDSEIVQQLFEQLK